MPALIRWVLVILAIGVGLFVLIQFVPVNRENPPVVTQVQWDSPQTEALFRRSCADCHSNETVWPWYSRIAPVSWLVARDVQEGREKFNLTDLSGMKPRLLSRLPEELAEVIYEGEMPMPIYTIMHPKAKLTKAEQRALVDGLQQTLALTQAAR